MSAPLLCLAISLSAAADPTEVQTIYDLSPQFALAVRGQSPPGSPLYDEDPATNGAASGQTYVVPPNTRYPQPMNYDPFLGPPPGTSVPGPQMGIYGPRPYRYGWQTQADVGFITRENTSQGGAMGKFGVFMFNSEARYVTPWRPGGGWTFGIAPQFNYRAWNGPGFPHLPPSVYRLGLDLALESPGNAPVAFELGFNPSIDSDFKKGLSSDAWQFDARAMMIFQTIPGWQVVLGAGYWDRVDDIVVPFAGVVWIPNDLWEFRILWPESRISLFLGNSWWGKATWFYARGEYHVEAYEYRQAFTGIRDQIQLSDYRILMGLRSESGFWSGFIEAGWVLKRNTDFKQMGGFDISDGFIARMGLRF